MPMTNLPKFVHSADKLAEMRTKFHIIQAKLIMSVWCFTVQCSSDQDAGDRFLATLVAQHIILVSLHTSAQTTDAVGCSKYSYTRRQQRVLYLLYKNIISFIKCSSIIFQMNNKLTKINMFVTFSSSSSILDVLIYIVFFIYINLCLCTKYSNTQ